jgi:flagellar hook-basal body complex protein FliE
MSGINGIGGIGGGGVSQIIALRQQIIDRSSLLQELHQAKQSGPVQEPAQPAGFADTLKSALDGVNATQARASELSEGYEKGEVTDIAKVMLARQEAGVAFEATLQVRNKLLSAYQDIMRMGV